MSALSGSAKQILGESDVVWPTSNDVVMGQVWAQLTSCNFEFVISRNAGAFLASHVTHSGEVVANVAEQLRLLGVRFIHFDLVRGGYVHITDEGLIAAEISAAFLQYYAFTSGARFPSMELVGALDNIVGHALLATSHHASNTLGSLAIGEHDIVDLTGEEEAEEEDDEEDDDDDDDDGDDEMEAQEDGMVESRRCQISEEANVIREQSHQSQMEHPSTTECGRSPLLASSPSLPSDSSLGIERGLTNRSGRTLVGAKRHEGSGTTDLEQSTGEDTSQRFNPASSTRAHNQVGHNKVESPEEPEPLELRGADISPFPGSYATMYAASFCPLDMTDLPHRTSDDMTGWHFFPIQLTQDLKDVPLINEWKVVVAPMAGSSGDAFTISP